MQIKTIGPLLFLPTAIFMPVMVVKVMRIDPPPGLDEFVTFWSLLVGGTFIAYGAGNILSGIIHDMRVKRRNG